MALFILFVLGVCIGSFLNVLIDRLPNNENPLAGRSYCDKCKKTLKWYDLIPVISFILLRGKCRKCDSSISYFYPLVELISGILFILVFINLNFGNYLGFGILNLEFIINYFYYLFIVCSLIVIFFADIKYGIIPDSIVYPAIAVTLIYHLSPTIFHLPIMVNGQWSMVNYLISGIGAFLFFLFLFLITRGKGMGFGDVKLALLLGIFLGFPKILIALYIAFLTGAIIGLILIIWRKKKLSGGTIPFGPFLVFGAIISLFFGEKIIQIAWGGIFLH